MIPCRECGATLNADALVCSTCNTLVHEAELEQLAKQAREASAAGHFDTAATLWSSALKLLPPDTAQYRAVQARLAEAQGKAQESQERKSGMWARIAAFAGPAALIVWKFKAIVFIGLTKGKFLLLGLTKASTFLSMLAWVGVYWALYGWPFAVGSVLSIYVHEMGHVMALHRFGIAAGAPMFIPGLGAFIRLRQLHMDPIEDSRVGLAGPLYGFGAAIFAYAVYSATGWKAWQAIAHFGAFINLFNLIPVWQLDGARGWRSLAYQQRLQITGLMALLWVGTSEPLLLILALVAGFRCFKRSDAAEQPDTVGFWQFGGVLVGLSLLAMLAKTSLTGSE